MKELRLFLFFFWLTLLFIFFKVTDLHQGHTYVFKVRAVNDAGVGKSSEISEPVFVEASPGNELFYLFCFWNIWK